RTPSSIALTSRCANDKRQTPPPGLLRSASGAYTSSRFFTQRCRSTGGNRHLQRYFALELFAFGLRNRIGQCVRVLRRERRIHGRAFLRTQTRLFQSGLGGG